MPSCFSTAYISQIHNRQVIVQERLPGVALNVAAPYLSLSQKESFKRQTRDILHRLHTIKPSDGRRNRSYLVEDPNILTNGRIHRLEQEILFSPANVDPDMSFMHNDLNDSNCIVDQDKIVGIIDWEMAGFFGWNTAAEIHRRIRSPERGNYSKANLSEEKLQEIIWWNDLYDEGMPKM